MSYATRGTARVAVSAVASLARMVRSTWSRITAGQAVTQVAADRDALASSGQRPVSRRGPARSYAVAVFAVAGGPLGEEEGKSSGEG
jgi:hypothetical protein